MGIVKFPHTYTLVKFNFCLFIWFTFFSNKINTSMQRPTYLYTHANIYQKLVGIAILISDRVGFTARKVIKDKEGQ